MPRPEESRSERLLIRHTHNAPKCRIKWHTEVQVASRVSYAAPWKTTSDRDGHLYDAARDRLRYHLDQTYTEVATEATATTA
jgi:hypothetical protein